ncbi:hypothetical protein Tco_0203018, partial [Tanacetum coccineum]
MNPVPSPNQSMTDELMRQILIHNQNQQGALPSDTVPTPRGEIKSITTQSGIVLAGPSVPPPPLSYSSSSSSSSSSKEVEQDPEMITDQ